MKQKIRRQQKNKRRALFMGVLLFMSTILFFFIRNQNQSNSEQLPLIFPERTIYREVVPGEAYLLLQEEITYGKGDGIATFYTTEGEKVKKNYLVCDVNLNTDNTKLKEEIIKIQAAIEYKTGKQVKEEKNGVVSDEVENIIRNIQTFIHDEDVENIMTSINSLDLHSNQIVQIANLNELLKLPLDTLEERKENMTEQLAQRNNEYRSPLSGIVTFSPTDIKQMLDSKKDFSTYTKEYLEKVNLKSDTINENQVISKQPIFSTIDNMDWYMAVLIKNNGLSDKDIGTFFTARLNDGGEVEGKLISINSGNGGDVAILHFNNKLEKFYTKRKYHATIIKNEEETYAIPTSALVENTDGTRGVYVEEVQNLFKFVPVDVIHETRTKAYIRRGNRYGKIGKDESSTTVAINDRIIVDPGQVNPKRVVQ